MCWSSLLVEQADEGGEGTSCCGRGRGEGSSRCGVGGGNSPGRTCWCNRNLCMWTRRMHDLLLNCELLLCVSRL